MIGLIVNLIKKYKLKCIMKKYKKNIDIGNNTIFLPSASINIFMKKEYSFLDIGDNSVIGSNFTFETSEGYIKVGSRTYIGGGTNLISRDKIVIGDDVIIAWGCYIYDHNSHSVYWNERELDIRRYSEAYLAKQSTYANKDWKVVKKAPIIIKDKVWIGFESVILKGVVIGEGAVIAARSVVTKDVEPWTVVAGNPAKVVKRLR